MKLKAGRLITLTIPLLIVVSACGRSQSDLDATATAVAAIVLTARVASATPTPAFMPVTISIQADGSGDYATLEEAVRRAPHSATIRLGPGTYPLEERLNVRRSLRLEGSGMDETEIVSTAAGYVIRFTGDGPFAASDLTIHRTGSLPGAGGVIRGGEIEFARCRITGAAPAYEYEDRAGLWMMGETTGLVQDCVVEQNDSLGIYVTGYSA
ncbi:MAG: hypothetical protein E3J64_09615, partial [Anaerolineales bacterium]